MRTLVTAGLIGAIGLSGWVVDALAGLAPLTWLALMLLAVAGTWAWVLVSAARRADVEAAKRRRDDLFARRTRVVR
jgi:F0F1-type ATP synthase assembly protein I